MLADLLSGWLVFQTMVSKMWGSNVSLCWEELAWISALLTFREIGAGETDRSPPTSHGDRGMSKIIKMFISLSIWKSCMPATSHLAFSMLPFSHSDITIVNGDSLAVAASCKFAQGKSSYPEIQLWHKLTSCAVPINQSITKIIRT